MSQKFLYYTEKLGGFSDRWTDAFVTPILQTYFTLIQQMEIWDSVLICVKLTLKMTYYC